MATAPRRLARSLRESGLAHTLMKLSRRVIPGRIAAVSWFQVNEIPSGAVPPDPEPATGGSDRGAPTVRWASPRDVEAICPLGRRSPAMLRERFARGDLALVVLVDGEIAGAQWYSRGPRSVDGVFRVELADGELWSYDGLIAPHQRGRGLFSVLVREASRKLAREGYHRRLNAFDVPNRRAAAGARRVGARPLVRLAGLRLGSVTVCRHRRTDAARGRWSVFTGTATLRPDDPRTVITR